jgi:hypothetical protein
MKFSVTTVLALLALGSFPLAGCNTIKGLLGDKEPPKTEAEPSAAASATEAAPSATAPVETTAPEASAAPSADVAQISAANEADVKRFDDEQKLEAPADTKVKDKASTVIKEPPSGDVVALLQPGTEVKALSQRGEFTLVAFANPAKPEETLMGWTKAETVEALPAAAPAASTAAPSEPCVPGFTKVFVGVTERCEVVCSADAGCPTGQNCVGSAKESNAGVPGGPIKFCSTRQSAAPSPSTPRRPAKPPEPPKDDKKKKKTKAKKKADD